MNRRAFITGATADVIATSVSPAVLAAAGQPIGAVTIDLGASEATVVTVAKLGRDGVWRIIASGGQVPGNDIDAYMRDVISDVAKAA